MFDDDLFGFGGSSKKKSGSGIYDPMGFMYENEHHHESKAKHHHYEEETHHDPMKDITDLAGLAIGGTLALGITNTAFGALKGLNQNQG